MEKDRSKWNDRYDVDNYVFPLTPSRFLEESLPLILGRVPGMRALDLACGEGRNSIFLARNGFEVTAIDISEQGLLKGILRCNEEGVGVRFIRADLETFRLTGTFDLVLNFNFLLRGLLPQVIDVLAPGGVVVMETILDSPHLAGVHTKSFLLQPGELVQLFAPYRGEILLSDESPTREPPVAKLIFQKEGAVP